MPIASPAFETQAMPPGNCCRNTSGPARRLSPLDTRSPSTRSRFRPIAAHTETRADSRSSTSSSVPSHRAHVFSFSLSRSLPLLAQKVCPHKRLCAIRTNTDAPLTRPLPSFQASARLRSPGQSGVGGVRSKPAKPVDLRSGLGLRLPGSGRPARTRSCSRK